VVRDEVVSNDITITSAHSKMSSQDGSCQIFKTGSEFVSYAEKTVGSFFPDTV